MKRAEARPVEDDGKQKAEIAIPVFGYENHVSIDRAHGFVRRFSVTNAAAHDGARLPEVLDKSNTAGAVWADTAYRSRANEAHVAKNGFVSKIHFRRRTGMPLTAAQAKANATRSKVRSAVETVFAAQKHRFRLFAGCRAVRRERGDARPKASGGDRRSGRIEPSAGRSIRLRLPEPSASFAHKATILSMPDTRHHHRGVASGAGREGAGCGTIRLFFAYTGSCAKRSVHTSEQDRPDVLKPREAWFESQLDLDPDRLVFIDETWAKLAKDTGNAKNCRMASEGIDEHSPHAWPLPTPGARTGRHAARPTGRPRSSSPP